MLGFCATATKARQINDRQQQRAWRHLVQERLEQLVNELFLEVQVAVNDAAAVTRDMLEPAPKHRAYSRQWVHDDPEAAGGRP